MKQRPRITPEEKQQIIDMFNAMPADAESRYTAIAKKIGRATSSVFIIIKNANKIEPKIKYFNPKIFQF